MVCDNCQERDAVVNLTKIENNAVRQLHLCEQCAAERGVETTVATPKHPLGEFLQAVQQQSRAGRARTRARAPSAGSTMKDFRADGPAGLCALLHGVRVEPARAAAPGARQSAAHRPVVSRAAGRGRSRRPAVLGELRDQLRRAIEQEQFEARGRSCATGSGCWNDARPLAAAGRRRAVARCVGAACRRRAVHAGAAGAQHRGYAFTGRARDGERLRVLAQVRDALADAARHAARVLLVRVDELGPPIGRCCIERHLVSKELAGLEAQHPLRSGAAVYLSDGLSVMINEEDHLRMQSLRSGFELRARVRGARAS